MAELRQLGIPFDFTPLLLTCGEAENIRRMRTDGRDEERIRRAIQNTRSLYDTCPFPRIDVNSLTIPETVQAILNALHQTPPFDERKLAL